MVLVRTTDIKHYWDCDVKDDTSSRVIKNKLVSNQQLHLPSLCVARGRHCQVYHSNFSSLKIKKVYLCQPIYQYVCSSS